MKLYYFKQEALDYFKENVKHNIKNYSSKDNQWVYNQFDEPFLELDLLVQDFDFYIDMENLNKMDLENCKRLYTSLKDLSDSKATDERLWAGLTHSTFYKYVNQRWDSNREKENMKKENYVISRYFYGKNTPHFRNTLAKLWWTGRLTYDQSNPENPFHLTEALGRHDMATRISDLFTSNFSRNITTVKAFLETINDYELNKAIQINADIYRSLVQFINTVGGLYLIDFLSVNDLKKIIVEQLEVYLIEGPDVMRNKKLKAYLHDKVTIKNTVTNEVTDVIVDKSNIHLYYDKSKKYKFTLNGDEYIIVDIVKKDDIDEIIE